MPHNNRSRRPEPEVPPPSQVQDYLARKYASLGIDPPEPNGHQPGHLPASLSDERTDAAPAHSAAEQRANPPGAPCDERSNVAPSSPEAAPQNPHPVSRTADPSATQPKPLTRDQHTALDLLERGKTVTDIMDTLGFQRRTFYDWRDANPTFAAAVQRSRDERRGVLVDAVEDIQLAGLTLIDNYIRSDHASDSIRLRAVSLLFRYGNTENLLPRRLVANLTGPDGLTPIDQNPQAGPTAPAPSGEQRSDTSPSAGEQRSDRAHTTPEAESHQPNADPAPSPAEPGNQAPVLVTNPPTSHTEKTAESVRSVRFENAQSTTAPPGEPETAAAPSEIRTPNVSDGFHPSPEPERQVPAEPCNLAPSNEQPSDELTASEIRTRNVSDGFPPNPQPERRVPAETPIPQAPIPTAEGTPPSTSSNNAAPNDEQSDVAQTNGDERSNVAPPPPPPKPRETLLTDAFLAATFLHKHEPREGFERLLKHQLRAYAPATPQEEILTFRITQKSWVLRRLDTLERVIADSAVTKVRENHPNAAPAACIAMTFLTRNDTEETSFYTRIANQRRDHEAALDRLESKLQTLQQRREARQDRRESHEDRHRKPVQPLPLAAPPRVFQRAAA
jgi:hypothetical protein